MTSITFTAYGIPRPAGSKRAFPFKKADGQLGVRVTDDCDRTKNWQAVVADAAVTAMEGRELLTGPLEAFFIFVFPRPNGHFGTGRNAGTLRYSAPKFPAKKPDALKLGRSVEDSLTGIVYRDDAQIVSEGIRKIYGYPARVDVEIRELEAYQTIPD